MPRDLASAPGICVGRIADRHLRAVGSGADGMLYFPVTFPLTVRLSSPGSALVLSM